ncbi:MAG: hypothetical protein M5U14_12875 [Acidimicrobiia bacterium]|nr:hypothetical protein [Acidimicrobiia bacterium]
MSTMPSGQEGTSRDGRSIALIVVLGYQAASALFGGVVAAVASARARDRLLGSEVADRRVALAVLLVLAAAAALTLAAGRYRERPWAVPGILVLETVAIVGHLLALRAVPGRAVVGIAVAGTAVVLALAAREPQARPAAA